MKLKGYITNLPYGKILDIAIRILQTILSKFAIVALWLFGAFVFISINILCFNNPFDIHGGQAWGYRIASILLGVLFDTLILYLALAIGREWYKDNHENRN